jgi:hypothetical protein
MIFADPKYDKSDKILENMGYKKKAVTPKK